MNRDYKTDPEYIHQQYKNDSNLLKRMKIHRYNTNKYKWFNWIFDKFQIGDNFKILELGCGNGALWYENISKIPNNVEIVLSDVSEGMLEEAKDKLANNKFNFKVINAESIPYNDKYFDIIIANHMLYHVKDIDKALSDIKRTLKDDGVLLASTIGKDNMKELKSWVKKYSLNIDYMDKLACNFGVENGRSILSKYFSKIRYFNYNDSLKIPDIQPIIDYYESMNKTDDDITDYGKLNEYLSIILKRRNFINVRKKMGVFIAK